MAIANVEMTGKWEAELAKIERGEASADGFTHSIEGYTREITAELLGCALLFFYSFTFYSLKVFLPFYPFTFLPLKVSSEF